MLAESGTENDYIMQVGGDGKDNIKFHLGYGDDFGFQYGGAGDDNIEALGGDGSDTIYLDGGEGNDTIFAKPDAQNDVITINAGAGNDAVTYEVSTGSDMAFIDGGTGTDSLTARENGNPLLIRDAVGNTLYDHGSNGTVIKVVNLEQITVKDPNGNTIFIWNAQLGSDLTRIVTTAWNGGVTDTFICRFPGVIEWKGAPGFYRLGAFLRSIESFRERIPGC
jgi:hypothetical protein